MLIYIDKHSSIIRGAHMNRSTLLILITALITLLAAFVPSTFAYEGVSINIPALGVNSGITEFALNGRSWNINPWEGGIGHLQGTGWFDNGGNIALGGHSWLPDLTPGIFANLHTVQPGDHVIITVNGEQRTYAVAHVTSVSMYDLSVLYPVDGEQLTLITCDAASFDPNSNFYAQRVIVTAHRVA
jgi:LPXTG-site transpeptidase (sortase) family protein